MKYTIGVDFGTLSARAVVADTQSGAIAGQAVWKYANGVIDRNNNCGLELQSAAALANPEDYVIALTESAKLAVKEAGVPSENIIGIAVDATSCSLLALDPEFTPLCMQKQWKNNPHAYLKLWKHHAAERDAELLNTAAEKSGESFLERVGGKVSCEWVWPKIMETLREAPEVYHAAAYFMDLCDWLTHLLTGSNTRGIGSASQKALWSKAAGYPSAAFLVALDERLADAVDKLEGEIVLPGQKAGVLCSGWAEKLNLPEGIAVAAGSLDGNSPLPAVGLQTAGDALLVIGTSTTAVLLGSGYQAVSGICGIVEDVIIPGLYSYESGQSCVGDLFDWFVTNAVPASYHEEAARKGVSIHRLLAEKAAEYAPGEKKVIALDWWNGNRCILGDFGLTGAIFGLTLETKPEQIYRALIEATAFGLRMIFEQQQKAGVPVKRLFSCGGISTKDSFLMRIYADVLGMEINASSVLNAPALGSAIYAAAAAGKQAGGYDSVSAAIEKMANREYKRYVPNEAHRDAYEKLYRKYCGLHDLLGVQNRIVD